MSLNKAIEAGKEHRQPYRRGKAVHVSCRNRGGCPWCTNGRKYGDNKRKTVAQERIKEGLDRELLKD